MRKIILVILGAESAAGEVREGSEGQGREAGEDIGSSQTNTLLDILLGSDQVRHIPASSYSHQLLVHLFVIVSLCFYTSLEEDLAGRCRLGRSGFVKMEQLPHVLQRRSLEWNMDENLQGNVQKMFQINRKSSF